MVNSVSHTYQRKYYGRVIFHGLTKCESLSNGYGTATEFRIGKQERIDLGSDHFFYLKSEKVAPIDLYCPRAEETRRVMVRAKPDALSRYPQSLTAGVYERDLSHHEYQRISIFFIFSHILVSF